MQAWRAVTDLMQISKLVHTSMRCAYLVRPFKVGISSWNLFRALAGVSLRPAQTDGATFVIMTIKTRMMMMTFIMTTTSTTAATIPMMMAMTALIT